AELVAKYFGLQLALSLERLRRATLAEEDRELARARKFEKEGMISHVEVMGVKVARDAAERECLKARNHVRTARLELQRLLLSESLGELSTPLFVLKKPLAPMESWVELALKNNPELAAVEARVQQAGQGVNASRSSWFPQVMAFGQYYFAHPHQSDLWPEWLAGVGVNLTLWDARDRAADYRSARATLRQARSAQAQAMDTVRTSAETAWLNTQNAREQYSLTASSVALARENLKLKNEGFGEGLYTALDVTHARDQLLAAEVERRVAAFEFVVNYALLHLVSGSMPDFMQAITKNDSILEN
ncbi:MAG: TolC family protein, partial [Desulfovibrio sp.]|nr:TolC family protein [Desulfovibrio sp.]